MATPDRNSIDKLRAGQNLPPITDEEFSSLTGNGNSAEEVKAQELKKKEAEDKIIADAEAEKLRLAESKKKEPEVKELTDEELMELVAKKSGRKIASWEDLKPKEQELDAEKAKEEREADKWSWAYKNKVVKQKEYENFIADSKDNKNLIYRLRLQEALKEDPNVDEKEFELEFNEEFGIDQDPTSRRFKNGQATLNNLASQVLKNNYGSIYSLDEKYSQYEQTQIAKREQDKKLKEGAPVYKKDLDKVKTELKKIKAHISEGEEYEVEVLDESIDNVIDMMSTPEWAAKQIINGYTYDQLKDIAYTTVLKENFPMLSMEIAKQYHLKKAAGTKGLTTIIPSSGSQEEFELTDAQKKLKSLFEQNKPVEATAN